MHAGGGRERVGWGVQRNCRAHVHARVRAATLTALRGPALLCAGVQAALAKELAARYLRGDTSLLFSKW